MNNWKLGAKLGLGFSLIVGLLVLVSAYTLNQMTRVGLDMTEMGENVKITIEADDGLALINENFFDLMEASMVSLADTRPLLERFAKSNKDGEEKIREIEANLARESDKKLLRSARDLFASYGEAAERAARLVSEGKADQARELIMREVAPRHDKLLEGWHLLNEAQDKIFDEDHKDATATFDATRQTIIATSIVSVIVATLIGLFITRSLTIPMARVVALLQKIAGADLSETIVVDRKDELGDVLKAASDMSIALRTMINEIKVGSNTMASATSQINASSRRNVEGSQSQLSAVQETTTSTTELQETARVAGERAREIQTTLLSTSESGQGIKEQLGDATGLLGRAREELQAIVGSVQDLSGRNQQIGEIIESVADVADQTQLLAVNAAIEAAKAGEVGRGFGVVASEMKALAEQSKKAAQRIRSIVGEVQRATSDTVQLVGTGQTRLQEALDPVTAILPKVEKLTVQVDESGQSGRQIVAIVAQQGAGIEQISQAMKIIQGGVQEGLAQTQQVERAAESLTVLAAKLRDVVAVYRV